MERKIDSKMEGKIYWRKIKIKFKLNQLMFIILEENKNKNYMFIHYFICFFFFVQGLKILKICIILIIFDFFSSYFSL